MAIEVQKNQNENITPFLEYYISYAREVSEQRNVEKELIIKFVDRYNKQFIPLKFQFKEIEIVEPPYADIYNTVYQFLVEAVKNSIELVELESKMKF